MACPYRPLIFCSRSCGAAAVFVVERPAGPVRVPRRWRSACSRLDRNGTVSSCADSTATYVALTATQNPYEVDLWKDQPFILPI
jgi:hypothetical protein